MHMERGGKTRIAILTSDKLDFKTKAILRSKEGHYIIKLKIMK